MEHTFIRRSCQVLAAAAVVALLGGCAVYTPGPAAYYGGDGGYGYVAPAPVYVAPPVYAPPPVYFGFNFGSWGGGGRYHGGWRGHGGGYGGHHWR